MDEDLRTTYEPPAIEERQPVIGLMGNSYSECVGLGAPPDVCAQIHPG